VNKAVVRNACNVRNEWEIGAGHPCRVRVCTRFFSKLNHTTLNLATRFWADVRFVFRNSAKPLHESARVTTPSCQSKTNGFWGATFQRTYSSGRFAPTSHARSSVIRHELTRHRRWLASHTVIRYTSHIRSWQEEALRDVMLSQQQGFPVSLKEERGVFIHDESLRTASPLHSFAPDHPTPRFDWRRRAPSRAPSRSHGHRFSCDGKDEQTHVKRVVPQQLEIEPGGRFYHEVKAYEDRWVLLPCLRSLPSFFLPDFYPCWRLNKPKRRRKCAKDWQNGPSKNCVIAVIASPGCRRFG
jgi:hypothetical protein